MNVIKYNVNSGDVCQIGRQYEYGKTQVIFEGYQVIDSANEIYFKFVGRTDDSKYLIPIIDMTLDITQQLTKHVGQFSCQLEEMNTEGTLVSQSPVFYVAVKRSIKVGADYEVQDPRLETIYQKYNAMYNTINDTNNTVLANESQRQAEWITLKQEVADAVASIDGKLDWYKASTTDTLQARLNGFIGEAEGSIQTALETYETQTDSNINDKLTAYQSKTTSDINRMFDDSDRTSKEKIDALASELDQRRLAGEFNGENGYSPSAKVEPTTGGVEITITDKSGTTKEKVLNGKNGADGSDYVITDADKNEIADNVKASVNTEINELKSDLDNYINVPHIIDVHIEKETGKAYNTTNGTYVENLSGFECASIPVNQNDTLIISGWGGNSNSYKPRFWSDTEIIETISTAEDVFTDVTVTVPIGANRLLINGRTAIQSIIVKKFSQNDVSKDFYASYGKTVGVNYSAEKTVDVFIKDYSKGKDLIVRMWGKASNNLPDFGNIGTVENDGIYVLDSIGDKTIASITRGTTDFLSPSVVYAVNNADGDYIGNTDDKLTGGWHGFNNATSGATATARNTKFIVSCDGNPLNIGEKARGNEVTIEITNRLQGSNTEKQDGSGREIVEQYFRITIGDGFKIKVDGEIRALEDIAYQTYYGLSLYHTMPNDVYFVGSRTERGAKSVASVNRCGDTNCVGIRQVGEENTLEMLFDSSYDLGTQYANAWGNSCTMSSNKSYLVLIKGRSDGTERLQLNNGDRVYWRGYYNFYPTN